MYTVKIAKKSRGLNNRPLGAGSLFCNALKVAKWSDDYNGDAIGIEFVSADAAAEFLLFAKPYLAAQKNPADQVNDPLATDWTFIEKAIRVLREDHEEQAELMKLAKKGICYRVRNTLGHVMILSTNERYTAQVVAEVKDRHGEDLVDIVNETLGMPLLGEDPKKIAANEARSKKLCETVTLFVIANSDGSKMELLWHARYSDVVANQIRESQPNLVEILNERYL